MALVGNVLLGTGAAPGMSSIASAYAESAASSRIPWSALEYSGQTITAISGSAIGGQGGGGVTGDFIDYSSKPASNAIHASADQLVVNRYTNGADVLIGKSGMFLYSAGVSAGMAPFEYAANAPVHVLGSKGFSGREGPDAASPKMRLRAASGLQIEGGQVGSQAFYSAGVDKRGPFVVNSAGTHFLSAKQDKLTFGYDGDNKISSIDGSAIAGGSNVTPADVSAIASSYANDKLDKTASSTFQPSGNYAYASSLSSYLPKSASGNFAPSGDYAYNSSLSGKLDNSASSTWYPMTGNPSGFLTEHQSLTGYTPKSAISSQSAVWNTVTGKVNASDISAQSATWNTVSAKADATAVHTYTGVSPVVVNNTTDQISLSASSIHLDTSLRSYVSGNSGFIGMAYPMQFISNSSEATGSNILYVVIGG